MNVKFEKDIKIVLNEDILENMKICVNNASPNEACGFVFGKIKEIQRPPGEFQYHYISKLFKCFESNQKSPVAFLINDIEQLDKVFRETAKNLELQLISIFHSHPSGNRPSGTDINNMKYLDEFGVKWLKNQIWTIMDAKSKKMNAFIYFQKKVMQVDLIYTD
ncbi:MAG: Mov34/MPN/PAD-1 family protein [Promethearchaeota archaeon]